MQKIKIITDSASDITSDIAAEHNIGVIGFQVTIDDRSYQEGNDITTDEFYQVMDNSKDFPHTAQITFPEFSEIFEKAYSEGYTDVIYVSISSTGSNTFNNANMAKEEFFSGNEDAKDKFAIHIIDSKNYSASYGYPVIQAAMKAQKGISADEITAYLEEWFSCAEMYFAPYTLEYVKRSGRLSAAAAFAGELLGLRPIIKIMDGISYVPEKVRGDKNIIPKLLQLAEKQMIPQTPYIILAGSIAEYPEMLAKEMTKKFGYPPEYICKIGVTVSSHAGHKVVGYILKGKKRGCQT